MYTYQWYHWLSFFYIYCFFGWIFESTYVSLKTGHFVNRGFLRLPMLPLYGTGAVMMLWVSLPVRDNLVLVYISGVVAATVLEYVTGWSMERLFKMKYWDYSNQRFQINGYICLTSSIAWGFLTILLTEVIHQPIAQAVLSFPSSLELPLLAVVSGFFFTDTIQSTKEALALGKALEAMTRMKGELEEMQTQLALLKAQTAQRVEEIRGDARHRVAEWKNSAAGLRQETLLKAAELKEEAASLITQEAEELEELPAVVAERVQALLRRKQELLAARKKLSSHMSLYRKGILKGNPSASSKRFGEALKELQDMLNIK